jgi:small subunit ribosomal protein S18e
MGSLLSSEEYVHIIRLLNTNLDGSEKIVYALTKIKGIGRRFADLICKKGEIDTSKRAGEFKIEQMEKLMEIVANPQAYKIPRCFLIIRKV